MEQQQQNYGKLPDYNESPGQPDDLSSRSGSTNSQTALQPQNQGYPPQYPQQNQSYPPQNQGYPPQYPPQNQGYPPQYPQYPQQNQGYPQEPPPGYGQPTYYQPPQQPQPLYTQQNVYVQQPQVQIQAGVMPPSNIPGSLFATIFCCFAFGIIASIYASKSLTSGSQGNYAQAQREYQYSRRWMFAAIICGVLIICLSIGLRYGFYYGF